MRRELFIIYGRSSLKGRNLLKMIDCETYLVNWMILQASHQPCFDWCNGAEFSYLWYMKTSIFEERFIQNRTIELFIWCEIICILVSQRQIWSWEPVRYFLQDSCTPTSFKWNHKWRLYMSAYWIFTSLGRRTHS